MKLATESMLGLLVDFDCAVALNLNKESRGHRLDCTGPGSYYNRLVDILVEHSRGLCLVRAKCAVYT